MPSATDYAEAVQNPSVAFRDPDLRAGHIATNTLGLPLTHTGNFAAVFEVASQAGQQRWAAKCFTRQVAGLQERYRHIAAQLEEYRHQLPFTVRFRYLSDGILVRGKWHPVLKMDWVEGLQLDEFLADCLAQPNYKSTLRILCEMWLRMARLLRDADVGHGDLQHGNVLLVPAPEKGGYHLRLIDYDGMYVPALGAYPSSECGHAAYQHPERLSTGAHGLEIDRFSHLLIYCTLRCLIVGGRSLWDRHYDGDRLLLGPEDLDKPEDSPVFRELWQLPKPTVRDLVGQLIVAAKGRLEDVPPLEQFVDVSNVVPLAAARCEQVEAWMSARPVPVGLHAPLPPPQRRELIDADGAVEAALPKEDPVSPIIADRPRGRFRVAWLFTWVIWPIFLVRSPVDGLLRVLAGKGPAVSRYVLRVVTLLLIIGGAFLVLRGISYVQSWRAAAFAAALERSQEAWSRASADADAELLNTYCTDGFAQARNAADMAQAAADQGDLVEAKSLYDVARERLRDATAKALQVKTLESQYSSAFSSTDVSAAAERLARLEAVAPQHPLLATFRRELEALKRASMPARYELTVDPPEAEVAVTGTGATISGSGARRTLRVVRPDGKGKVLLVATLTGYERLVREVQPKAGDSGLMELVLNALASDFINSIEMQLVLIPAGEFRMGSPSGEADHQDDEYPHRVRITQPFYLGVHEVTQGEYERVMGENPSRFTKVSDLDANFFPVEDVSWEDAVFFCRRLSAIREERSAGRVYRLPTEAEWEYACRAGTTTPFHFGSKLRSSEANFRLNYPAYGTDGSRGPSLLRPKWVGGSGTANRFGLYDMHGNVEEWCQDWYGKDYYRDSPVADPPGPTTGSSRVSRGGSWKSYVNSCRSANRHGVSPVVRRSDLGFRVAAIPGDASG